MTRRPPGLTRDPSRAWLRANAATRRDVAREVAKDRGAARRHDRRRRTRGARRAAERIRARLAELRGREQDEELFYSLPDPWKRKLFVALCRRYGLNPYRERGRRFSTVIVRAPKAFQNATLWPEFLALSKELHAHLDELTDKVIREAINEDLSEAAETSTPRALPEANSG